MSDHDSLNDDDEERLLKARTWVKGHFTHDADEKYATVEGKLRVLDAILSNDWVAPDEKWKLQALGIAFGDALAQKLMLDWVAVDDELGRDPALNWPGTSLLCYPLTIISKRVEAGERVDVHEFFAGIEGALCETAFSGRCD